MSLADIRPSEVVTEEGGKLAVGARLPNPKSDMDITKVGEDLNPYDVGSPEHEAQQGHDTYVGIPGDGIVPR